MDKAELLDRLQAEHSRLEETLSRLTPEQMAAPKLPDGWSVKDTLAHLAIWNRRGTTWLAAAARGETPQIPAPGATWTDMDRMNAESYRENLGKSPEEALTEYRESYRQLVKQLQALTNEVWEREYRFHDDPQPTPVSRIAEWRLRHLVAHSKPIHALVEGPNEETERASE